MPADKLQAGLVPFDLLDRSLPSVEQHAFEQLFDRAIKQQKEPMVQRGVVEF